MTSEVLLVFRRQIALEIDLKIQLLERRAAVHATMLCQNLQMRTSNSKFGFIPKFTTTNNYEIARSIIEKCQKNKAKLLLLKRHLNTSDPIQLFKCLSGNRYAGMSNHEILKFIRPDNQEEEDAKQLYISRQKSNQSVYEGLRDSRF